MTLKHLLKDVTFDFEVKSDGEETSSVLDMLGPHIAYTIEENGGACSGYNKAVLLKADEIKTTPDILKSVESLGVTINKAFYTDTMRSLLNKAVREKQFSNPWDWVYISDFNDTAAIISTDYGLFSVNYTINGANVEVEDVATPVAMITDYVEVEGEILISEEKAKELAEDVMESILRSVKIPEVQEHLLKSFKKSQSEEVISKDKEHSVIKTEARNAEEHTPLEKSQTTTNGETSVDIKEIMKSAEFQDILKAQIEAATAAERQEKEDLQKSLKALQDAETKRQEDNYNDIVKGLGFVAEDKQEALVKAFMADPAGSLTIIEVLKAAKDEVDAVKAEFGAAKGVDVKVTKAPIAEGSDLVKARVEDFAKILKK